MKKILILFGFLTLISCKTDAQFSLNRPGFQASQIDPDAQIYFSKITSLGGTLSAAEKLAVDTYIKDAKTGGSWASVGLMYPFLGGNLNCYGVNLRNPNGANNITWNNGELNYFVNGVKGDLLAFYGGTNQLANSVTQTNQYASYFIMRRYNNSSGNTIVGAATGSYANMSEGGFNNAVLISYMSNNNTAQGQLTYTTSTTGGYVASSRTATNSHKIFLNGSAVATQTTNGGSMPAANMFVMARNNGGAEGFANAKIGYISWGAGLTDTQAAADATAVAKMMTTLNRNVVAVTGDTKLVFDGDSIMEGNASVSAAWAPYVNTSFSNQIAATANYAVGGSVIADLVSRASTTDAAYDATKAHNVLVILVGTNNVCDPAQTSTTIFNDLLSYVQARQTTGWTVVVNTVLPRTQTACGSVSGGTFESTRLALNTNIRNGASTYGYYVADIAGDATIGTSSTASNNTTYYKTDKVHLATAGAKIVAIYNMGQLNRILCPN